MRGVNEGHFTKLQGHTHNVRETVTKTIFSIPLGHANLHIVQKSLRIIAYFVQSVPASTDPSGSGFQ